MKVLPMSFKFVRSVFCRAAGREHYEAGRTVEALECLKAAAENDENAITLTNLGSCVPHYGFISYKPLSLLV